MSSIFSFFQPANIYFGYMVLLKFPYLSVTERNRRELRIDYLFCMCKHKKNNEELHTGGGIRVCVFSHMCRYETDLYQNIVGLVQA
jgi:hypothetical protein